MVAENRRSKRGHSQNRRFATVSTLANFGNVYERVQDDVVQIGWAIHQVVAGKFPLSEVAGLPFVEDGFQRASLALNRLVETRPP